MGLIVSCSDLPLQTVKGCGSLQHYIDYGTVDMIFCRSRVHHLDIFQSVNRSSVKQLIKILERHVRRLAIENNGHI